MRRNGMAGATMVKDLVCGMTIDPKTAAATRVYEGTTYYFCAQGCAKAFDKDPKKYIQAK
jgi:P-type Cu+ transporter